ncbi:glutaredoxin-C6 [Silene latifolia]|uniref:glutaredoxin-C6 n=1 Tax=Silene latifolia TaxID=37657 RepID=UPI003D76E50B
MQGVEQPMRLELTTSGTTSPLAIDMAESAEARIQRLITENPAVIFSRSSCCMCHVMKNLLQSVGVHPTVIELDETEILAIPADENSGETPVLFVGGNRVGGLESLVALHLTNRLATLLADAGAVDPLWG